MPTDDDKRLYEVLLVGSALAVAGVAALTAWAASLGGGTAWPLVLAPFAVVLAVPLAVLAWLLTREDGDQWSQAPSGTDHQPALHTTRTAA